MRSLLYLLSVATAAIVGGAVFTQMYLDWSPCVMCVEIRAWLLFASLGLFVAASAPMGALRNVFASASIVGLAASAYVSGSLFALERGWVQSFGCSPFAKFPSWMPLNEWIPVLFQPEGICGESVKTVLWVPLSAWPVVWFVVCSALILKMTLLKKQQV